MSPCDAGEELVEVGRFRRIDVGGIPYWRGRTAGDFAIAWIADENHGVLFLPAHWFRAGAIATVRRGEKTTDYLRLSGACWDAGEGLPPRSLPRSLHIRACDYELGDELWVREPAEPPSTTRSTP